MSLTPRKVERISLVSARRSPDQSMTTLERSVSSKTTMTITPVMICGKDSLQSSISKCPETNFSLKVKQKENSGTQKSSLSLQTSSKKDLIPTSKKILKPERQSSKKSILPQEHGWLHAPRKKLCFEKVRWMAQHFQGNSQTARKNDHLCQN